MLAFLKWASQGVCQCYKLADGYLQSRCYRLLYSDLALCESEELAEWTSSMLVATLGRGTISFDLASRLRATKGTQVAREEIFAERFLWTEELSARLSGFENEAHDVISELPLIQDVLGEIVDSYTNDHCLNARSLTIHEIRTIYT